MFTNRVVWITGAAEANLLVLPLDVSDFDALRAEVEDEGVLVSTITRGFIRTETSNNALSGDGSRYDKMDDDIAGGMDVNECAEVIIKELGKGKREIAVGKGKEMAALWVKRLAPELLFKLAKQQN